MGASAKAAETSRDPSAVTSVIRHTVGAGSESRYEAWFRKVAAIAETFPGYRGVDFIRPPNGSRTYTITLRLDTNEHLERWLLSDAPHPAHRRDQAVSRRRRSGGDRDRPGIPVHAIGLRAKACQEHYKQFLITWSVSFPLTIFIPWVLHPLFQTVPFLGLPGVSNLLISAMIVGLLTYVSCRVTHAWSRHGYIAESIAMT